mmetsp:Transcript_4403/g.8979  ORF Transcript_4403/g.8979 Transcript_4403/m.8979 type:complete len:192 (-) Transcript_4403:1430-2005(-)
MSAEQSGLSYDNLENCCGVGFFSEAWRSRPQTLQDNTVTKITSLHNYQESPFYLTRAFLNAVDEYTIHSKLNTRCFVRTLGMVIELEKGKSKRSMIGIILEECTIGAVADYLPVLTETDKTKILVDILDGVYHMHSIGLSHNDLHFRNVLLTVSALEIIIIIFVSSNSHAETGRCQRYSSQNNGLRILKRI